MKYKRKHRRGISLACHLMRAGRLDVCLDCGSVYTHFGPRRRKRRLQRHYKGYLWVKLYVNDRNPKSRRKPKADGRRRWEMSAWVHRLSYMKKRAVRDWRIARRRGELPFPDADWKSFVFDLPASLDIDHKNKTITDNRGRNLRARTHRGNSGKGPMTAAEQAEVEATEYQF